MVSSALSWNGSPVTLEDVNNFHQETSKFSDITRDVPQGPILGSILFLLFINDISKFTVEGCVLNIRTDSILRPANERRHYKVMPSLIGWAQT